MNLTADVQWLSSVLLASVRVGAVFLFTPILAVTQVPVRIRVLIVLGLAAVLVTSLPALPAHTPHSLGALLQSGAMELLVGVVMAFGVLCAFAVFNVAGRILDSQMGFGVADLIDPSTQEHTALMGAFLSMVAVMVFFLIDGHHLLLRGLAYSFKTVPLGQGLSEMNLSAIVAQFGYMFAFALMAIAPAMFGILLLDIGMGVMARSMPQVNIFFVSFPLKIFLGLVLTAVSIRYIWPMLLKVFTSIFTFWEEVLV